MESIWFIGFDLLNIEVIEMILWRLLKSLKKIVDSSFLKGESRICSSHQDFCYECVDASLKSP